MNRICEQVRDLLAHDRGNLNFSPASRYAVSKLCDYAEQEHEQREKAETILCGERRKALRFPQRWRGRNERLTTCGSSYRLCSRRCRMRGREYE